MRLGILGGTFDPPHLAHLVAAEAAYRNLGLDLITFVPAGAPWQKAGSGVTDATHRLEMVRLATQDVEYFDVDDREVMRDGWSYTIDTVESFAGTEQLTLILGADAAARIGTWHRSRELLSRVDVAVVPRPGVEQEQVVEAVGPALRWIDMPQLAISGTELRGLARAGGSLRFLVADAVWSYLQEHDLYRPSDHP